MGPTLTQLHSRLAESAHGTIVVGDSHILGYIHWSVSIGVYFDPSKIGLTRFIGRLALKAS